MFNLAAPRALAWRLPTVLLGISGLRLERTRYRPVRLLLFGTMTALYYLMTPLLMPPAIATGYAAVVWLLYYGGLSLTLSGPGRTALIKRFGEDRAYALYEVALGLLFMNQGFAQAVVIYAYGGNIPDAIPTWVTCTAGAALMITGTFYKLWAASTTGLDTYYCRDMFLGRPLNDASELVVSGPYRHVRNPMYSVGNLPAYGWALWSRSLEGLAFAALFQAGIYLFYHLCERPFIQRTYLRLS
ncbi:PEMT/PEM2 methyltransferase family protein [Nonomuraea sp. B19D2]|uniref:PEMT/PEM2 family methyltransferase n=1 Tax=Nonomuraea sp. B19D2 TaxID=3159561 RepID=UPI0032DA21F8